METSQELYIELVQRCEVEYGDAGEPEGQELKQ